MKLAEKVARLGEAEREEIAAEIAAGGDPAEVVAAHLPEAAPAEVDPDKEYELLLAAGTRAVAALDGRVGEVRGGMDLDQENKILETGHVADQEAHRPEQGAEDAACRDVAGARRPPQGHRPLVRPGPGRRPGHRVRAGRRSRGSGWPTSSGGPIGRTYG